MKVDLDAWDMLPGQKKVYEDDWSKFAMFAGGLGSGKTHVGCRKALKLSAINQHVPGGFLAPSFADYLKDVHPELEKILIEEMGLTPGKHFKYNENKKTWKFFWSRAPMYVFTAEKPIAGPNLGWGVINEYSLIKWERIHQFMRRMRVKCPQLQVKFVGTPEDVHGWLEEFVQLYLDKQAASPDEGIFALYHAKTDENHHNDKSYVSVLTDHLDARALEVFRSGQIVKLHGNYFYYAFTHSGNVTAEAIYNPDATVYASLDFNVGKMTTTLWHIYGKEAHAFDEIVLRGNSDTPAMASALKGYFPEDPKNPDAPYWKHLHLHMDSSGKARNTSGKSDLKILQDEKFEHIHYRAQNPRMRQRQLNVNGKLEKGHIKINPKCKTLIKDLKSVKQLVDFTKDKTNEELTHASDTLDYFIDYHFPFYLDRTSSTIQL